MKMLVQRNSVAAVAFRRLAVAASIGLLALTSQFSHASTVATIDSEFGGNEEDGIDRDLIADAELTELSVNINLNPYIYYRGHRGKNSRHLRKRYSNVQRKSYNHRYRHNSRFRSYGRSHRPIFKGHRRHAGSRFGYSRRRH